MAYEGGTANVLPRADVSVFGRHLPVVVSGARMRNPTGTCC